MANVAVEEGDAVARGQTLFVVEAMKMEHAVVAPRDGRISLVAVTQGEQVDASRVAVVLEADATRAAEG